MSTPAAAPSPPEHPISRGPCSAPGLPRRCRHDRHAAGEIIRRADALVTALADQHRDVLARPQTARHGRDEPDEEIRLPAEHVGHPASEQKKGKATERDRSRSHPLDRRPSVTFRSVWIDGIATSRSRPSRRSETRPPRSRGSASGGRWRGSSSSLVRYWRLNEARTTAIRGPGTAVALGTTRRGMAHGRVVHQIRSVASEPSGVGGPRVAVRRAHRRSHGRGGAASPPSAAGRCRPNPA